MKKLSTITQFIAKVKGKKGSGRWEVKWKKGERIEGRVRGVRLGKGRRGVRGRKEGREGIGREVAER
jgi:hypothetical protein